VFGLAIMIERLIYLFMRKGYHTEAFMKRIMKHVQADEIDAAIKLCDKVDGMSLARVVKAALSEVHNGAERVRNTIDEVMLKVVPKLEKRTNHLAMLSNVATLLGLMGTIYGLILSFAAVGKPGIDPAEKATLLAQGISAAMFTTYLGLLIAIPTVMVFSFFKSTSQQIIDEIDEYSLRLGNVLSEKGYKTKKYHISAGEIKEGIGLHVTANRIKVFTDNRLIKEFEV
jgi:biopolymer transport protein ExbB/TolQ